ncbi:MAG TPA: adenylate/guanylate cyclase domain-containing protein [bacterium]|nr:adenylate/guanylate cyclase domain-containing protein [bacterium]
MSKTTSIKSGERRNATILFADLQGFTALSERMDPEEMDALMSRVFGMFEDIIVAHGGVVEKYIGDALVAVFGVPQLHEDDAQRALESAMAFLERNRALENALTPHGTRLSFRIGVHAGLIATGDRGSFKVVTGHPMAIAQRLQDAAEPDSILASDAVKERCDTEYDFEGPLTLSLKGTTEALIAWRLRGSALVGLHDAGPFIGRKDALDELMRLYVRHDPAMTNGRYLVGEAGIGKTRLAQALVERIKRFPDFMSPVLMAKAQKYRPERYAVIIDLVLEYIGVDPASGAEAMSSALAAVPGIEPNHARRFTGLAHNTGRTPQDSDVVLSLFSIFSAIMQRHAGAVYPALLFIDNVQDMDRPSREFLAYYFKNGAYKPFALMAGRDHPASIRDVFPELKPLRLGPLSQEEAKALVHAHWKEAPERSLEAIIAQSGGNPLFIREYALFAMKHKDLSNLPGTIQNMFMASLDRYEPATRAFITAMSVFLQGFDEKDAARVYEAYGGDPGYATKALDIMARAGILTRTGDRFAFALDVFKKALYASILNHNKKILHGIVADIMLERGPSNRLRLLYHLMKSERWAEASDVIRGDPARNYTYEYLDYIDALYKRLSRTAPDDAIQLLIAKSALYFNAGKIDEAECELKRVMRFAVDEKDDLCMGFAYHMVCAHNSMSYGFQKSRFTGQKALYYYRKAGMASKSIQNVLRHMAFAELQRNNFEEARALVAQMSELPDRDAFELASAQSEGRLLAGDYHGALRILDATPRPQDEDYGFVARFFGMDLRLKILWQLCDFPALEPAARALLEAGDLSDTIMSQAQAMLAVSAALRGDNKTASEGFMQSEYYSDKVRNDFDRVDSLRTMANCLFIAGNIRKAESVAREALVLGLRHSCFFPTFTVLMLLVQISAGRGDLEQARFFLVEASYFSSTGLLLPNKDTILYYYWASRLLDDDPAGKRASIAHTLLMDEISRLGDPRLVANFRSTRGFGDIERALAGTDEEQP